MILPPPADTFRDRRVHLIGIGGCGMSGAAAMLLEMGATVSGSDADIFDGLATLVAAGARIGIGHRAEQVHPKTDLVVISAAIPDSNPELIAARHAGVPVIKYAEMLGTLMERHLGIAVAGTHGKSTTTALTSLILRHAGLDPSYVFGATSAQLGGSSGVGCGRHLVVEACEFDRSFLRLHPYLGTILNIEHDHVDCYRHLDDLIEAFGRFAAQVHPDGLVIVNDDDPGAKEAARVAAAQVETFGFGDWADWQATHLRCTRGCYQFRIAYHGACLGSATLGIPGRHNVANALAAAALAFHSGADPDRTAEAITAFTGIQRRLSWRGSGRGVTIVDDYAHHPTEIRVTIGAARDRYEPKRTLVVFQPHQYARTCDLMDDFARAFAEADEIIVPNIYTAREPGARAAEGSAELVARIRANGGRAQYRATLEDAARQVVAQARSGDLVITMGAGDVWKIADELVERLCGSDAAGCATGSTDLVPPGRQRPVPVSAA